jgi:hypothetical protein
MTLFELMDSFSFFLFAFIFYFLSALSRRLGEVMGMKKYYYLYYAGIFFAILDSILNALFSTGDNRFFIRYGFFSIGLTLSFIASIIYWGWLIKEFLKKYSS